MGLPIIDISFKQLAKSAVIRSQRGGKSFIDGVYMLEKSVKEIESELDKEFSIMIDNLFK